MRFLFHVQLRDQIEGLEDKTDVLPPKYSQLLLRHGKDIFPINPNLTRCRIVQGSHNVQQRAFARVGFTNDGNKLPPADGERNLI